MICEYEERSKKTGNCVFAYNCNEDCYFAYKYDNEYVDELEQEVKELKEELWDSVRMDSEIEELRDELEQTEQYKDNLLDFCKLIMKHPNLPIGELKEELLVAGLEYNDKKGLEKIIEEKECLQK